MKVVITLVAAATTATLIAGTASSKQAAPRLLLTCATALDAKAGTVTLPLLKGRSSAGKDVWYVVTESSSQPDARPSASLQELSATPATAHS